MQQWQETCCSHNFNSFVRENQGKCQTLPQVILHQSELVNSLVDHVHNEERNSIVAFLEVLASLSKDLSLDFLPHFDTAVKCFVRLIDEGADRDANALEAIFDCLSWLCKLSRKRFCEFPLELLTLTSGLRLHRCRRVRHLTAHVLGFTLRSSSGSMWTSIYAELVATIRIESPNMQTQLDFAIETGELLYHCVSGAAHDLHPVAFDRMRPTLELALSCDRCDAPIHAAIVDTMMQLVMNHVKAGQRFEELWEFIQDLLRTIVLSSTNLTIWTLLTRSISRFTRQDQLDFCVNIFNGVVTIYASDIESGDEVEYILQAQHKFVTKLFELLHASSDYIVPSDRSPIRLIPWRLLMPSDHEHTTLTLLHSLFDTCSKIGRISEDNVVVDAFRAARTSLLTLGESAICFARKIALNIRPVARTSGNRLSLDVLTAEVLDDDIVAQLIIEIYYMQITMKRGEALRVLVSLMESAVTEVLKVDEVPTRNTLAVLTACVDSANSLDMSDANKEESAFMVFIAGTVLHLSSSTFTSRATWGAISDFCVVHRSYLESYQTSIRKRLIEPAICMLDSEDKDIRKYAIIILHLAASNKMVMRSSDDAQREADDLLTQSLCGIEPELDVFCMIHTRDEGAKDVLYHMKRCTSKLSKFARSTSLASKNECQRALLVRCCLGSLHVRLTTLWPALSNYVLNLMKAQPSARDLVVKKLLSIESLCAIHHNHIVQSATPTKYLHTLLDDAITSESDHFWPYMHNILSLLADAELDVQFISELAEHFLRFVAHKNLPTNSTRKAYDQCLVDWLRLLQPACALLSTLNAALFLEAFETLLGHDHVEIARGALRCLQTWGLNHVSSELVDYLGLLLDERTFKTTLATKQINLDTSDELACFPLINVRDREKVMPYIVRVLQRHARRNDKYGSRSAALRAFSLFNTIEILPFFMSCISGVVDVCEAQLHEYLLDSLLLRRPADEWLSLQISLNTSSKSMMAFLLNTQNLIKHLRFHLHKCSHIFVLITFKVLVASSATLDAEVEPQNDGSIDRRTKFIHRESINVVASIFEHFPKEGQCFWPIIAPVMKQLAARVQVQVEHSLPPYLRIVQPISSQPDVLFGADSQTHFTDDVCDIIMRSWHCLNVHSISVECRLCLLHMLHDVTAYADDPKSAFRPRALDFLRRNPKLALIALSQVQFGRVKGKRSFDGNGLLILQRLVHMECVDDTLVSDVVKKVILTIAAMRRVDDATVYKLLLVLREIVSSRQLDLDLRNELLGRLAFLFEKLRSHVARCTLLDVFEVSGSDYGVCNVLVTQLKNMHAIQGGKVDEPDFETRLRAYSRLTPEQFSQLSTDAYAVEALVRQCLYDIKCTEFSIRLASRRVLASFVSAPLEVVNTENVGGTTQTRYTYEVIVRATSALLMHRDESVRSEGINLMKNILQNSTKTHLLKHPHIYDAFLDNICHIQPRHQSAALQDLAQILKNESLPVGYVTDYFLPLLKGFLHSNSTDVVERALSTVAVVLPFLTWSEYVQDLRKLTRSRRSASSAQEKYLYMALIHINSVEMSVQSPSLEIEKKDAVATLGCCVLPILEVSITAKETAAINHTVSHAMCALICLLEPVDRDDKLRAMMSKIAVAFCARSQKVRDSARRALLCLLKSVPSVIVVQCLHHLISRMDKGFTRYVRAALVALSLEKNVLTRADFKLMLPLFVKLIEDDFFGDLYDASRCDAVKEFCKECKTLYPLQSTYHIFKHVFDEHTLSVGMRPVKHFLCGRLASFKVQTSKLHAFHDALRRGLRENSQVSSRDVLLLFFSIFSDCADALSNQSERMMQEDHANHVMDSIQTENLRSFANMSLGIVSDVLEKKSSSHETSFGRKYMDDMLCILLSSLLRFGDLQNRIIVVLKRAFGHVPQLFREHFSLLTKNLCIVLKRSSHSDIRNSVYELLSKILRTHPSLTLPDDFCDMIVRFTVEDIARMDVSNANFSLLQAIVGSRIFFPHLYEVVEKMMLLNATGHTSQLRTACSKFIVQFILAYPIGERKMRSFFDAMLPNADYEYTQGRLSVLGTVSAIVEKIPEDVLAAHSELLLLFFLTKIASEEEGACRLICTKSSVLLLRRIPNENKNTLFTIINKAINGGNVKLSIAGLQVLKRSLPEIHQAVRIYGELEDIIISRIMRLAENDRLTDITSSILYNYLLLFEHAIEHHLLRSIDGNLIRSFCRSSIALLHHRHIWVQMATCRVLYLFVFCRAEGKLLADVLRPDSELLENMFDAFIGVLHRLSSFENKDALTQKTMSSLSGAIVLISASVLSRGEETSKFHERPRLRETFRDKMVHLILSMRTSTNDALQELALRWVAALAVELKDELACDSETLNCFLAICHHREGATEASIRLSNEVLECLSRHIRSETWANTMANVDSLSKVRTLLGKRKST
ncbi:hypothetical protein BE221DRAFT_196360 [Ostreococcus tauri]|uniref:Uncharacterized protein n=1 Tax=Ostreococcus tauri TaxID=70448 RepID=A0A1Y5I478_OSTTA|nr:hypothetical protein BE221DRAFT_196360 [Ostreococcus tauri]